MNYFEELLERERLIELDKQYFYDSVNVNGSRYIDEFMSTSDVIGKGGFGFLKKTNRKKSKVYSLSIETRVTLH